MNEKDGIIRQNFLKEYRKSIIQSEAEVRSKFVIPLLDLLGYPSEFRAEEYPVYAYAGGEKLRAKNADFIFFDRADFGLYRKRTQNNLNWVYEHSLLVIETKKPGKLPEGNDLGQAQFYTVWTRAVGYIETDGERIIGRIYNCISKDYEVINTAVDNLASNDKLSLFAWSNICKVKERGIANAFEAYGKCLERVSINAADVESSVASLPAETIQYMEEALGKNAEGLTRVQLVSRFLDTTETFLRNDIRYGVSNYILDFPRNSYNGKIYLDNMVLPFMVGTVTEFYWSDIQRYQFESKYIQIILELRQNELMNFEMGYRVLDQSVVDRIHGFSQVNKCLVAESIRILIEDKAGTCIVLPTGNPRSMWKSKKHVTKMYDFWLEGMYKLRSIEEYYEIKFRLQYMEGSDRLNDLYEAIDFVYDGMCLKQNCEITLPGDLFDEDFYIEEPMVFQENVKIPLPDRIIQGVVFRPYRSVWLPSKASFSGKTNKDIVRIPGCCEYKVVEIENEKNKDD